MTDSINPRAMDVADRDAERSHNILNKVRNTATEQLNTQKNRASEGLGSVAQAVRQSTQQLRDSQHGTIAQYVEQAAEQIERFSQQLRGRNVSELFGDVQRLARQRPAVFVGGAFALGLISARFFKSSGGSSSPESWRERRPAARYQGAAGSGVRTYSGAGSRASGVMGQQSQVHDYASAPPLVDDTGVRSAGSPAEGSESGETGGDRTRGRGTRARRGTQSERS